MGIGDWFRRGRSGGAMQEWRAAWNAALAARDETAVARLRGLLDTGRKPDEDREVEEEMLEALERFLELSRELDAGRLPRVETTHRVIGADICHFRAPASLPDDPAQPSGRVLFASTRALFVGGAKLTPLAWHAVREVGQSDRDLWLVRSAEDARRFRFNSFTDAICAAALARHLKNR